MDILRRGHTASKKLDAIQDSIAAKQEELKGLHKLPLPDDEARLAVRQALANKLESLRGTSPFGRYRYERSQYIDRTLPDVDWSVLLAIFGAKELEDRICATLAATPGERGLPADKRAARGADLRSAIAKLERDEEAEVQRLEDAGHIVLRRPDANPQLMLEIANAKTPPTPAPQPRDFRDKGKPIGSINEGAALHKQAPE